MGSMFKSHRAGGEAMPKTSGKSSGKSSSGIRRLTCGKVMEAPRKIGHSVPVLRVLHTMTARDWDHVYLVDDASLPVGRLHAVDLLKLIDRKRVNRDIAWMEAVPAIQCVNQPPLSVRENTPLLKAIVLMLTHDLNQLAVVDAEGALIGVVSHAVAARHLPRYIL